MIDELDAVARFGSETAPPTPEARAGARRALGNAISAERAGRPGRSSRAALVRVAAIGGAAAVVLGAIITFVVKDRGGAGGTLPGGLRSAILTAYNDASSGILRVHQTLTAPNGTNYVEDQWSALSAGGHQAHTRIRFSDAAGAPIRDVQITYTVPPDNKRFSPLGDVVDVEYPSRTWFHATNGPMTPPPWDIPDAIAVGSLGNALTHGRWSDLGATTVDGQAAIELVQHNPPGGRDLTVWVDPASYRPFREAFTYTRTDHGHRVDGTVTSALEYLRPTPTNLAQLKVTVPPGFRETAPPR